MLRACRDAFTACLANMPFSCVKFSHNGGYSTNSNRYIVLGSPFKARVLFPFVGDAVGGSHIAAVRLVKAFANSDVDPLVALHQPGPLADYLNDLGVPFRLLPEVRYVLAHRPRDVYRQFLAIAPRLAWFARKQRIDIVHTNDQRMFWTWLVPTLLAHKKFLLHLRYLADREHPTHLKLMPRAHGVVCDSEQVLRTLRPEVRARAKVIRSSIDWDRPSPDRVAAKSEMLNRLGHDEEVTVIGFFANFLQRKRPLTFVEVAARIADSFDRPVAFVMFGRDRENFTDEIRTLACQRRISDSLHLMGFAPSPEELMAGCDLLIAPAVREPLGLTLLEGYFVGTPVIAANDSGHQEIYGSVVPELLVKPDDLDGFCRAALMMLRAPEQVRALMEKARADLSRRFSMPCYARSIEEVYRGLMD